MSTKKTARTPRDYQALFNSLWPLWRSRLPPAKLAKVKAAWVDLFGPVTQPRTRRRQTVRKQASAR